MSRVKNMKQHVKTLSEVNTFGQLPKKFYISKTEYEIKLVNYLNE